MPNLRNAVKLSFVLLTLWLGLVWANMLPRPSFFPLELDIKSLTFIVGAITALLLAFLKSTPLPADKSNTSLEPSFRDELITNLQAKYKKRIDFKLAGRFPVNLRINPSKTGTSEGFSKHFSTFQDTEVSREIGEIFDRTNGRLLVTGLPGAGKTTLLLQLALELLQRAENSITQQQLQNNHSYTPSIPVLLNLATWRSEFNTFDEWLRRILPNELGASQVLSERIYANMPLILLLDGLDEMPEQERNFCLVALGQYGIKPERQFVISSRVLEYTAAKDAPVYGQVEIAPLTAEQIEMNLIAYAGLTPEARPLLDAIKRDSLLKQSLENPFYLNTAQLLFASGKNWSEFGFVAEDVVGRQREVVQHFVEYALAHKEKRNYPAEKVGRWLRFFALKMNEKGVKTFELSDIDTMWVSKKNLWNKVIWDFISILIYTIFGIVAWGGFLLLGSVVFCIYFSLKETYFPSLNDLYFVYSFFSEFFHKYIGVGIVFGCLWWFLGKSIIDIMRKGIGLKYLTHWSPWFFISLTFTLFGWREFKFMALWASLLFITPIWIAISIHSRAIKSYQYFLVLKNPYSRFRAALKYLNLIIFEHLTLRFLLFVQSSLPIYLVYFLNEMSLRHILEFDGDLNTESGGGSWRWRHRIIQEWFLEGPKIEPNTSV
jgi:hypothetical protein